MYVVALFQVVVCASVYSTNWWILDFPFFRTHFKVFASRNPQMSNFGSNFGCFDQAWLYTQVPQKCFFKNGSRHLRRLVWWF